MDTVLAVDGDKFIPDRCRALAASAYGDDKKKNDDEDVRVHFHAVRD